MSYEATFRTRNNKGELKDLAYFKCLSSDYPVAFDLLKALDAPESMYQHTSFPGVSITTSKDSLYYALKKATLSGPNYYIGDEPKYYVKDILLEAFNNCSWNETVEISLF